MKISALLIAVTVLAGCAAPQGNYRSQTVHYSETNKQRQYDQLQRRIGTVEQIRQRHGPDLCSAEEAILLKYRWLKLAYPNITAEHLPTPLHHQPYEYRIKVKESCDLSRI